MDPLLPPIPQLELLPPLRGEDESGGGDDVPKDRLRAMMEQETKHYGTVDYLSVLRLKRSEVAAAIAKRGNGACESENVSAEMFVCDRDRYCDSFVGDDFLVTSGGGGDGDCRDGSGSAPSAADHATELWREKIAEWAYQGEQKMRQVGPQILW